MQSPCKRVVPALLFTLCSSFLLTACGKSPESTVEAFYKSIGDGEVTEAQTFLSTKIVNMMGKDKLTAQLSHQAKKFQGCGGISKVDSTLTGEGEIRSGKVTLTFKGDCPPDTDKVFLVKEEGTWKISPN